MVVAEPCRECGVLDALGRHAGTCPRAVEMGLPRLADGEEPIDPVEEERWMREAAEMPIEPEPTEDELLNIARERGVVADYANKVLTGLWMAYHAPGQQNFDAVVFDAEIDALRYAVTEGWQVKEIELGRSLTEQIQGS